MTTSTPPVMVRLTVHVADGSADVFLIESSRVLRDRSIGGLDGHYERGIYKLKIIAGRRIEEKLVALEGPDVTLEIGPLAFQSAAPLDGTTHANDLHKKTATEWALKTHEQRGSGSSLFVFARSVGLDGSTNPEPMEGLSLRTTDGALLVDLSATGDKALATDQAGAHRGCNIVLSPRAYLLRCTAANGSFIEQTIVTCADWQTQVFLLDRGKGDHAPLDLPNASIFMSKHGFDPGDPRLRLLEAARLTLGRQRSHPVFTQADTESALDPAHTDVNPLFALLVAHSVLLAPTAPPELVKRVLAALERSLGATHPDVIAIAASFGERGASISVPPMLRRSWALAVRTSITEPTLVPHASLAGEASQHLFGDGTWMTWFGPINEATVDSALLQMAFRPHTFGQRSARTAEAAEAHATRPPEPTAERLVQSLGLPRSVVREVAARGAAMLRGAGAVGSAKRLEVIARDGRGSGLVSGLVADTASQYGAEAVIGAVVLVTISRPIDALVVRGLSSGPYHSGQRSVWSHCFLVTEAFHGASTSILDCTIRRPDGRLFWDATAKETLEALYSDNTSGAGGIERGVLSDYDDPRVTDCGIKLIPSLATLEREAIAAAAEALRAEGIRYDLPKLLREIVGLTLAISLPPVAKRLFSSGFVQTAYRRAVGPKGAFVPTLASADVTLDDIWYSPVGNSHRSLVAHTEAPSSTPVAFSQSTSSVALSSESPRAVPEPLELSRAIDSAIEALSSSPSTPKTEATLDALNIARDQLLTSPLTGGAAGANPGDSDRELSLVASAIDAMRADAARPAPPGGAVEFDLIGLGEFEQLDPLWVGSLYDLLTSKVVPFPTHQGPDPSVSTALPATLALAGDWGTGNASSWAIAQCIESIGADHTIHLGDVYYAGTENEERTRFVDRWPTGKRPAPSFALNSNHEMYSGGAGYFNVALTSPKFAAQKGLSYFALECGPWIIVGVDTAYHASAKHLYMSGELDEETQLPWLRRIQAARGEKRIILLTHHNGLDLFGAPVEPLWTQVTEALGGGPDFWYWGHVHGASVYKPVRSGDKVVRARLSGHGGIPYAPFDNTNSAVSRFDWWETELAQDPTEKRRALNGFVTLELDETGITERFIDERGRERWSLRSDLGAGADDSKSVAFATTTSPPEAQRDLVYFNGVDGRTGKYITEPMSIEDVAARVRSLPIKTPVTSSKMDATLSAPFFGLPFQFDENNLQDTGWAVVFATNCPEDVKTALAPLIELRKSQTRADRFKVLDYQAGETVVAWQTRQNVAPGTVTPTRVPYYLMLVGSPADIPLDFQYLLDISYAVGRVSFDDAADYGRYAQAVLRYEQTQSVPRAKEIAYWGPKHQGDGATAMSSGDLLGPLFEAKDSSGNAMPDPPVATLTQFRASACIGPTATKKALLDLLGTGGKKPCVVFTASHGMSFPNGDSLQTASQGALLCQDWTGWGSVQPSQYLAASDVTDDIDVFGLIAFLFACFGAGTPAIDSFTTDVHEPPPTLAPQSFIASLPRKLLSGGALAVVGHVDRAWGFSIKPRSLGPQIGPFNNCLGRLLTGERVGRALKDFNLRYAELSTELLQLIKQDPPLPDDQLLMDWIERNDAQNYVLLGDPAVRLRASELLVSVPAPTPAATKPAAT